MSEDTLTIEYLENMIKKLERELDYAIEIRNGYHKAGNELLAERDQFREALEWAFNFGTQNMTEAQVQIFLANIPTHVRSAIEKVREGKWEGK